MTHTSKFAGVQTAIVNKVAAMNAAIALNLLLERRKR